MNWKLTQRLIDEHDAEREAQIEEWGPDGYRFGYSVLRSLAVEPDSGITQIRPGVYRGPKAP
jgi:hypothetical protein